MKDLAYETHIKNMLLKFYVKKRYNWLNSIIKKDIKKHFSNSKEFVDDIKFEINLIK